MQSSKPTRLERLHALDYFRGYAVLGMLVVNFIGSYQCIPRIFKHTNDTCSYADTIMPHFFFAVGFSLQWVWRKRTGVDPRSDRPRISQRAFWSWLIQRVLFLMVVSVLLYFPWGTKEIGSRLATGSFWFAVVKRDWFQTLLHIAITSIWYAPFLRFSARIQVAWIAFSVVVHFLLSHWFYFEFVHAQPRAIDGGPLGFLTWSIPLGIGALCCRSYQTSPNSRLVAKWLGFGLAMMLFGYLLSRMSELYPAGHPNYWTMSQRAGTPSYLLFAGGLSLVVFAEFFQIAERWRWRIPLLKELGQAALATYIVHGFLATWLHSLVPRDATCLNVIGTLAVFVAVNIVFAFIWKLVKSQLRTEKKTVFDSQCAS